MYIAFDGGNDDLTLAALGLAGGGNLGLDSLECGLGSRGGLQQLRQKKTVPFSKPSPTASSAGISEVLTTSSGSRIVRGSIGGGTGLCL